MVNIPAQAEKGDVLGRSIGEFLWEDDEYGYGAVMRREKATQPPSVWSALYQQRPTPETGDYFKREWFEHLRRAAADPRDLEIYGGSDFAVTSAGGDYTVHIIVGLDTQGRMYVLDIWREQSSSDRWIESMIDLIAKWRPIGWAVEQGQIKSAVGPFLAAADARAQDVRGDADDFPTRATRRSGPRHPGRMAVEGPDRNPHVPWVDAVCMPSCWPAGRQA